MSSTGRVVASEALGTALLLAIVVGSGIIDAPAFVLAQAAGALAALAVASLLLPAGAPVGRRAAP
jgi:hypothetical protein